MRLSEKTIELNYCAEMSAFHAQNWIFKWFGLTNRKEAKLGYDICTQLNMRFVAFQFKASSIVLPSGDRRFTLPVHQMNRLIALAKRKIDVYYAFPLIGTSAEFVRNPAILNQIRLYNVMNLPAALPKPHGLTKPYHYADVSRSNIIIRSEPHHDVTISPTQLPFMNAALPKKKRVTLPFDTFLELNSVLGRNALAMGYRHA